MPLKSSSLFHPVTLFLRILPHLEFLLLTSVFGIFSLRSKLNKLLFPAFPRFVLDFSVCVIGSLVVFVRPFDRIRSHSSQLKPPSPTPQPHPSAVVIRPTASERLIRSALKLIYNVLDIITRTSIVEQRYLSISIKRIVCLSVCLCLCLCLSLSVSMHSHSFKIQR